MPTLAAEFNAKDFFLYFDKSCDKLEDIVNEAGDDMNALVQAALDSLNWTPLSEKTFAAYWGKITPNLGQNSGIVKMDYQKLGKQMATKKYSLYCDASAFSFVTTQQEGENKDKPWDDGKGRWYIAANRRAANIPVPYILGDERPDFCTTTNNKIIAAASVPGQPYIILCPDAFTTGSKVKYTSLLDVKDTVQPDGTNLDEMESTGAIMLHEFTHAVLGTNRQQKEIYGQLWGRLNALRNPSKVRKNADTFSMYGKACYLEQNAWVTGRAEDKTKYDVDASSSERQPPSPTVRLHRRRLLDRPLYARGPGNSTNATAIGTGTVLQSLTPSVFNNTAGASSTATSFETLPSSLSTVTGSDSAEVGPKTSSFDNSSSLASTTPGLKSFGNGTSTVLPRSSKFSESISSPTGTPLSSTGSSPSPSSSSSVAIPGSGILPFPITTTRTSSSSPTSPFTWSGSWSDTTTPTPVDFTFFNIPTAVMSDQAATSEAVLLGGLFFALQANRKRLTDPKLKSQYLDDVERTKDETQALFNNLNIKPDMPDCSKTKRNGKRNALSERQLRALLRDRNIIGSIGSAIKGAINDASKLVSCSLNVVKNLADTIEGDTPDINLVENLTDTLAEIGKDLEEEDEQQSSTENLSSRMTTRESWSSSSSSSSCTGSTVIPMCTETISFSTSFISGTSVATVGTITQTTCLTTTIAGCTGSGTTSITTASSSSDADNEGGTLAIFYFPTDAPDQTSLPPESVSWLNTAFLDEYTESVSYNGTTAGPATSTAPGGSMSSSGAKSTNVGPSSSPTASLPSLTSSVITTSTLSTSTSAVAPPPSSSSPPLPPYQTGVCSIHITEKALSGSATVEITASIKDGGGKFLASTGTQSPKWGGEAVIYGSNTKLPYDVTLTFSNKSTTKRTLLSLWRRMYTPASPPPNYSYEKWIISIQAGATTFNTTQTDKTKMPW
ncbi:hypothetical protein LAWI1_G008980, partial [Lachnellula willkommii]